MTTADPDPEDLEDRRRRALSEARLAGRLGVDAPAATVNNPRWFEVVNGSYVAVGMRRSLHTELLDSEREAQSGVPYGGLALVVTGPPGAGDPSVVFDLQERLAPGQLWRNVDAEKIADWLLQRAVADDTYEQLIPPGFDGPGEPRIHPRELVPLLHHEAALLAGQFQDAALALRENVVINGALSDQASADELMARLRHAGYRQVHLVSMEADLEVATARVERSHSEQYEAAETRTISGRSSGDELGERWQDPRVLRRFFPNSTDISVNEEVAQETFRAHRVATHLHRYRTLSVDAFPTPLEVWRRDAAGLTHCLPCGDLNDREVQVATARWDTLSDNALRLAAEAERQHADGRAAFAALDGGRLTATLRSRNASSEVIARARTAAQEDLAYLRQHAAAFRTIAAVADRQTNVGRGEQQRRAAMPAAQRREEEQRRRTAAVRSRRQPPQAHRLRGPEQPARKRSRAV